MFKFHVDLRWLARNFQEPNLDKDMFCPIDEHFLLTASPSFCDLIQYSEVPPPPSSLSLRVQELTWSIKGGTRWPQLCKNASLTRPHADARSSTSSEVLVPSDFNSSQSGIQDQPILVHEKWVGHSCQLNDANFLCLRWNNQLCCYWH